MQCKDLFDVAEQRLNDLFRETVVMLTLLASLLQQVLGSKTSYHLSQHSLIKGCPARSERTVTVNSRFLV